MTDESTASALDPGQNEWQRGQEEAVSASFSCNKVVKRLGRRQVPIASSS